MSLGYPRDRRITRGPDLQRVLKEGKRIRTKCFDVRVCVSPLDHSGVRRVGLIVPKARHTAVERNLLKRRLKELTRHVLLPGPGMSTAEIVLLARGDTYRATFSMLSQEMQKVSDVLRSSADDTK